MFQVFTLVDNGAFFALYVLIKMVSDFTVEITGSRQKFATEQ